MGSDTEHEPDQPPEVFQRTKRQSSILGYVGILFALVLSGVFMLVGVVGLTGSDWLFTSVFGLIGVGVFVICMRGGWMLASGPTILVIAFDADEVAWGYAGKEKTLPVREIREIHWTIDLDNELHLSLVKRDGKRVRFYYIDQLIRHGDRGVLLAYFSRYYPRIPVVQADHS